MSPAFPRLTGLAPRRALPGGRVRLEVADVTVGHTDPPTVRLGDRPATVSFASSRELAVVVPADLDGGRLPVRLDQAPGSTAYLDVGRQLATGLHMVDSPAVGPDASVYATYSGARGQQSAVSIYRVRPDGVREVFASDITNATSLAFDPQGRLHVSSRYDGTLIRLDADGTQDVVASDLGVATGIAFDQDGTCYVGDRSGTIFRVGRAGGAVAFASLPPSVAAFHLAWNPRDAVLYASVPTLATRDVIYRVDRHGTVTTFHAGFGRPQGLAIDAEGTLYVAEALAGSSGIYRLSPGQGPPELLISGVSLVGVALHPGGGFVASTAETLYRFDD